MPKTSAIHGVLVLDKPRGMTSTHAGVIVRKWLRQDRLGHLGTLDPMATGVLPLLLGEASKLANALPAEPKEYEAIIRFGAATNTWDAEGEETEQGDPAVVNLDALKDILHSLTGEVWLRPPAWSAIKVDGAAAYKRARRGETVDLPARLTRIHQLDILDWSRPDLRLRMVCGGGSYVRSVAHELGQRAGCPAHLAALRRTRAGIFHAEDAMALDDLKRRLDSGGPPPVLDMGGLSRTMRAIELLPEELERARHGQLPPDEVLYSRIQPPVSGVGEGGGSGPVLVMHQGRVLAWMEVFPGGGMKLRRVMVYDDMQGQPDSG
ncbi:MAG: tRNA pseudouridine synthase B [Myxococcota bacterium]|nr:tRNA pseudouridine synthase B [Myxococcota bacterium]